MRTSRFLLTLVAAAACTATASAVDLRKIDRAIAKEPVYQSRAPKYCLLVFGPEAKTHVWLVRDGAVLYVDHNGNGDLTEPSEGVEMDKKSKVFEAGEITEGDGQTKHTKLHVMQSGQEGICVSILIGGKNTQSAGYDDEGPLEFADRPQDAPIIHFNGLPTLRLYSSADLVWRRGERDNQLMLRLGIPGVGKGTFITFPYPFVPPNDHPVADVEFPNKLPGAEPITVKFTLRERC